MLRLAAASALATAAALLPAASAPAADWTGSLVPQSSAKLSAPAAGAAWAPDGRSVYVVTAKARVEQVLVDPATRRATPGPSFDIVVPPSPTALLLAADGRRAYVPGRGSVAVLARDAATGALSSAGCLPDCGATSATAGPPHAAAVLPSGGVLVLGRGRLQAFAADGTPGAAVDAPDGTLAVSLDGRSAYVGSGAALFAFAVGADGTPTATGTSPLADCAAPPCSTAVQVSPDGAHVYAQSKVFARDAASSALTPAPCGDACFALREVTAFSPDGRQAYIAEYEALNEDGDEQGEVQRLLRDPATGRLSAPGGEFFATDLASADEDVRTTALAVSPDGRFVAAAAGRLELLLRRAVAPPSVLVRVAGTPVGRCVRGRGKARVKVTIRGARPGATFRATALLPAGDWDFEPIASTRTTKRTFSFAVKRYRGAYVSLQVVVPGPGGNDRLVEKSFRYCG